MVLGLDTAIGAETTQGPDLYSAFYNTRLSQSSFTMGPGLRSPQSLPRATVARKNSLTNRKKP